jgi:hypothetical protein
MKRLINILIIFAAVLFMGQVKAQVIYLSGKTTYDSYTHTSTTDTIAGTTEKTFDIFVGKDYLYYYDIQATLDSLGDGTDITLQIKGSNDNSKWFNVGSSITWGVSSSTDSTIQFTNVPNSESWSIAQHARTTAATADYHAYDTTNLTGGVYADTVTVGARVETVAAQTYTITKDWPVSYTRLRLSCTGEGAGAGGDLVTLTVKVIEAKGY